MTENKNILVLSAGRRVSLVSGFMDALNVKLGLSGKVFTADMSPNFSAACAVSDQAFYLPHVSDDDYSTCLLDICQQNSIGMVIPTIDTELPKLSEIREQFKANSIEIVVSSQELIKQCSDKRLTALLFDRCGAPRPKLYSKENIEFPVLVKPYDGALSEGVLLAKEKVELPATYLQNPKNIFCEYIDHDTHSEYTVDAYYDRNSQLKCVVPRKRIEVRGGEVSKAITNNNDVVTFFQKVFRKVDGARGCLTFQLFTSDIEAHNYFIEINPRFGGGYPLTRLAGADYQEALIKEYLLDDNCVEIGPWEDQLIMLRYDAEILSRQENGV